MFNPVFCSEQPGLWHDRLVCVDVEAPNESSTIEYCREFTFVVDLLSCFLLALVLFSVWVRERDHDLNFLGTPASDRPL